eukprot:TRINITY_DN57090_c0_g1_i1.p1 TRINITY_DN57090_c0_g1~~TRINITY_DN57090_c0_g1_i1.p1  ORF type:complete len:400 (-),score=63.72 TRINITY_DN57090_c0_g1_i1:106-1305(-)
MVRTSQPKRRSALLLRVAVVGVVCLTFGVPLLDFITPSLTSQKLVAQQRVRSKSAFSSGTARYGRQFPALQAEPATDVVSAPSTKEGGVDLKLIIFIALWYAGNYYYNITNKLALKAAGGAAGFPMTIATLQLAVGCLYAWFLWAAPDARPTPKLTVRDVIQTLPVGFTSAGAHAASVFALSAGAVSFGQIVKAAEPAFAALLGTLFYGSKISVAKWLCLIPVIGGVVLASLGELDFAWAALVTAAIANVFAAIKANENKKLMNTEGLRERMGSVGNQFAVTMISSFLFCLVLMIITEGSKFGQFVELVRGGGMGTVVLNNLVASGIWFYLYNELATITIKKTGAVTQSVLNTAKRAVVILGVAMVLGESLDRLKLIGSMVCIGGVFLYSIIDRFIKTE